MSLYGLACLYDSIGDAERALELHQKCLDIRVIRRGTDHPHTLASMHALANILMKVSPKDTTKARQLYEDCFNKRKCILGLANPETVKTKRCLETLDAGYTIDVVVDQGIEEITKQR